jgi:hypothetical protein
VLRDRSWLDLFPVASIALFGALAASVPRGSPEASERDFHTGRGVIYYTGAVVTSPELSIDPALLPVGK